jgi:YihY family inner membrane protein
MSTASAVPETVELEGDDALATLRDTGWGSLARDALVRFSAADGLSHARALAFQITLTSVPALIATVGLATALEQDTLRRVLERTTIGLSPGPTGEILTQSFQQASDRAGTRAGQFALVLGLLAAIASATIAMAQVERGANRIYGVERDLPNRQRYLRARALAGAAGFPLGAAFVLLVIGAALGEAIEATGAWSGALLVAWEWGRWPLGIALIVAAFALLFKKSPRRNQPAASWLLLGSMLAVLLWVVLTALLAVYLGASQRFGNAYGPLLGVLGAMLWAFLTSLALFLGLAFAAQLEAVRAGSPDPRTGGDENPEEPAAGGRRRTGAIGG